MSLTERGGQVYHTTTVNIPLNTMDQARELGISLSPTLVEALQAKIAERTGGATNQTPVRGAAHNHNGDGRS
jgi:hypothetical protein